MKRLMGALAGVAVLAFGLTATPLSVGAASFASAS